MTGDGALWGGRFAGDQDAAFKAFNDSLWFDKTLIAYRLMDTKYQVTFSVEYGVEAVPGKVRIPPFEELEMDLRYIFGDED